jgi:hypothetical protein
VAQVLKHLPDKCTVLSSCLILKKKKRSSNSEQHAPKWYLQILTHSTPFPTGYTTGFPTGYVLLLSSVIQYSTLFFLTWVHTESSDALYLLFYYFSCWIFSRLKTSFVSQTINTPTMLLSSFHFSTFKLLILGQSRCLLKKNCTTCRLILK